MSAVEDKLIKVINHKKDYLKTLMEKGNKPAAFMLNSEINFLEKEILPIIQQNNN